MHFNINSNQITSSQFIFTSHLPIFTLCAHHKRSPSNVRGEFLFSVRDKERVWIIVTYRIPEVGRAHDLARTRRRARRGTVSISLLVYCTPTVPCLCVWISSTRFYRSTSCSVPPVSLGELVPNVGMVHENYRIQQFLVSAAGFINAIP